MKRWDFSVSRVVILLLCILCSTTYGRQSDYIRRATDISEEESTNAELNKLSVSADRPNIEIRDTQESEEDEEDEEDEDPFGPADVGNVCSDPKSINYNADENAIDDEFCKYPAIRDSPESWISMPDYCYPSFTWDLKGLSRCYEAWASQRPPWIHSGVEGCKGSKCVAPIAMEVLNVILVTFEFNMMENIVSGGIVYAMRWKDPRLYKTMLQNPSQAWTPKVGVNLYLLSRGDTRPLETLDIKLIEKDKMVYIDSPPCTTNELELIKNGSVDINCCESGKYDGRNCAGAMQPFQSFIDCPSHSDCKVQIIRHLSFTSLLKFTDVSAFPYDTHTLRVEFFIVNPYESTSEEWWRKWKPPPPTIMFQDIGSNRSTVDGSLLFSLNQLNPNYFSTDANASILINTSLPYFMATKAPDFATKIVSRGVGGLAIDIFLVRKNALIIRLFTFPMVLMGVVTCCTPMLDDDAVVQITNRIGFSLVSILTALVSAQQLTQQTRSHMQTTCMDQLALITMSFGVIIILEALTAYVWWRYKKCNSLEPWTCWFVRVMDRSTAVVCMVMYLYLVGVVMLVPQSTTSSILWGILGFLLSAIVLVISFFEIRRYAIIARVNPVDISLMNLTNTFRPDLSSHFLPNISSLNSDSLNPPLSSLGDSNDKLAWSNPRKLMAKTSAAFDKVAVWRTNTNDYDQSNHTSSTTQTTRASQSSQRP